MWTALAAAVVALACSAASARRLALVIAPTPLAPRVLLAALEGERGAAVLDALQEALADDPRFAWERDLLAALDEAPGPRRDAGVNEQVLELESRRTLWARVPRVCASIATTAGLLFGSIAMLEGMGVPSGDDAAPAIHDAMMSALGALSLGVAGTAFCIAVQMRARRLAREERAAMEALLERLERLRLGPVPAR